MVQHFKNTKQKPSNITYCKSSQFDHPLMIELRVGNFSLINLCVHKNESDFTNL